jgi:hypothetical protein
MKARARQIDAARRTKRGLKLRNWTERARSPAVQCSFVPSSASFDRRSAPENRPFSTRVAKRFNRLAPRSAKNPTADDSRGPWPRFRAQGGARSARPTSRSRRRGPWVFIARSCHGARISGSKRRPLTIARPHRATLRRFRSRLSPASASPHIGGTRPSLPTRMRAASIEPSASV